jgi:hypothetical protein
VKIGIISDTHVRSIEEIPAVTRKVLANVDLIVHAGDFTEKAVLDGLRLLGQLKGVRGNMDSVELRRTLPEKDVFQAGGKKIGVIHGSGGPWGRRARGAEFPNAYPFYGEAWMLLRQSEYARPQHRLSLLAEALQVIDES